MKVIILDEAYDELNDAIEYYEGEQSELGKRMMEEVDRHINWIIENPSIPRLRKDGYRRVNLKVFPYYIAYMIHENALWILAIAHSFRKPEYWVSRRKNS